MFVCGSIYVTRRRCLGVGGGYDADGGGQSDLRERKDNREHLAAAPVAEIVAGAPAASEPIAPSTGTGFLVPH